jgi:hypothetical protein
VVVREHLVDAMAHIGHAEGSIPLAVSTANASNAS